MSIRSILRKLVLVVLMSGCAVTAEAQVNDSYEHAMNSGWKQLQRRNFEHALYDFKEARDVHASEGQQAAEAQLGIGECYLNWIRYDHSQEKYVMDALTSERAIAAFRAVSAKDKATPEQGTRALLGLGKCYLALGKTSQVKSVLTKALQVKEASVKTRAQVSELLTSLEQDASAHTRLPVPDLIAAYAGVYPESASNDSGKPFFTQDALGGTLSRDHQSRAMYYEGRYRRTYIAYLDHHFMARVTYYDHDKKVWARRPEVVDQCQDSNGFKDGHNSPNIFISRDGTIHLFYGTHGGVLKYARSEDPESIKSFQIGMRIGRKITYPYLCQRSNGELLMFYRRSGPRGGYYHGHLALRRSSDNGTTWSDIHVLLQVEGSAKLAHNAVLYNPKRKRIQVMPMVKSASGWNSYFFEYDPDTGHIFTINGTDLGTITTEKALEEAGGRLLGGNLDNICLGDDGLVYMVGRDKDNRKYFGNWDGTSFTSQYPEKGILSGDYLSPIVLPNGEIRVYGLRDHAGSGLALNLWTTRDKGKTWSDVKVQLDASKIGHPLKFINLVMGYNGTGPILLASEPVGSLPSTWQRTRENHYDNSGRRDRRLYALDGDGKLLRRVSPFKTY